jgi:hypothetical protein
VNVAEDVRDSRTIEGDIAVTARLIEPKIESFALKKRKYVMKEGIAIWELDHGADRDHKDVGLETFMVLGKARRIFGGRFETSGRSQGAQPYDYVFGVRRFCLAVSMNEFDSG